MNWMKALFLALSVLAAPAFAGQPVNVNTATAQEIADGLDGVGTVKAERIIDYRKEHGPFQHADELVNVKGIGLKTVDRNRDFIRLTDEAKPTGTKSS